MINKNFLEDINKLIVLNKEKILYKNNRISLNTDNKEQYDCFLAYANPNISYSDKDKVLEINLNNILSDTNVYYNEIEFVRINKDSDCNSIEKNIAILFYKESKLLIYKRSNQYSSNFFISNQIAYRQFVKQLKSKTFSDDYNDISRQILLYSIDKGVYKIDLPILDPILDDSKDFYYFVDLFLIKCQSIDFILHFKNQLYNLPIIAEENKIQYIISVLSELINKADMEYQLFSKKFSFKKLRTELRQEKEIYFKSLTEVISKITTQIISVPISISAALLASYKSDGWLQVLILIVFWGYIIFVLKIHDLYKNDVSDLEYTLNKDFDIINRDSGFGEQEIQKEKGSIQKRIDNIKNIISYFKISFISIAVVLSLYIIWKLLNEVTMICSVLSQLPLAFVRFLFQLIIN